MIIANQEKKIDVCKSSSQKLIPPTKFPRDSVAFPDTAENELANVKCKLQNEEAHTF